MPRLLRLYLAGPEVFLPNAREIGAEKCRLAAERGFEGLFPLDAALDLGGMAKVEQATRISTVNEGLMRSCDALIANLTPFRGISADVGTAFEVGFMRALGRPVLGYTNTASNYRDRAAALRAMPRLASDGDRPHVAIEDFDLADNLMIEVAINASGFPLVRHDATSDDPIAELASFVRCLDLAKEFRGWRAMT